MANRTSTRADQKTSTKIYTIVKDGLELDQLKTLAAAKKLADTEGAEVFCDGKCVYPVAVNPVAESGMEVDELFGDTATDGASTDEAATDEATTDEATTDEASTDGTSTEEGTADVTTTDGRHRHACGCTAGTAGAGGAGRGSIGGGEGHRTSCSLPVPPEIPDERQGSTVPEWSYSGHKAGGHCRERPVR